MKDWVFVGGLVETSNVMVLTGVGHKMYCNKTSALIIVLYRWIVL